MTLGIELAGGVSRLCLLPDGNPILSDVITAVRLFTLFLSLLHFVAGKKSLFIKMFLQRNSGFLYEFSLVCLTELFTNFNHFGQSALGTLRWNFGHF